MKRLPGSSFNGLDKWMIHESSMRSQRFTYLEIDLIHSDSSLRKYLVNLSIVNDLVKWVVLCCGS